jgi:hypothetical protein
MLVKGIMTSISGSVGGVTGSHNRGGLYLRARRVPVNVNSAEQQVVRGAAGLLATAWVETLTPAQREAWETYATNVPLVGSLGDSRDVGGLPMYIRSNVARLQSGLDRQDDAPSVFDVGTFTQPAIASLTAATETLSLAFTNTDDWAGEVGSAMLVYASRPQNPSINSFAGPYRLAGSILGAGTPPTSPAAIVLPFPFEVGQQVFLKVNVTREDGRYSSPFRLVGTGV